MRKQLAPICLFTYNRINETQKTINALQKNNLALESDLIIFSDGPKSEKSIPKVKDVRNYIKKISGFKSITIYEYNRNKGLANSIIFGVSQIINQYGRVIVLEDDLVSSPNFLDFMNYALNFYQDNKKVFSISGYTFNLPSLKKYSKDYYVGYRASSWGWGTWQDRWENIDWEVKQYYKFRYNFLQQIKFMRGGSDMPRMLKNQMNGKIDSWAIRWCFDQFQKDMLTVFPTKSKIITIGIGNSATHTKKTKRFNTILDLSNQRKFKFDNTLEPDKKLIKEFRHQFSIINRLKERLIK